MSNNFSTVENWIETRKLANKRSGSVLISLMTDFVAPHGGAVALGSLVDAGALMGITEQTIRSSVNRLVADGWLTTEAVGRRSICRFSDSGQKRYELAAKRIYQSPSNIWGGEWHMIVANTGAIEPELYVEHVRDLLWSGFGRVADNVFIRPKLDPARGGCCNWEFRDVVTKSMVCFIGTTAQCITNESIAAMINRAWDIGTVRARYDAFIGRYEDLLGEIWKSNRIPGPQAFAIRSMLIHDFRRIRLIDPSLPRELHPANWNADRAVYIAHELYDLLMLSSEQYIMEVMQGPEGRIPYIESWFYDRFGGLTRA